MKHSIFAVAVAVAVYVAPLGNPASSQTAAGSQDEAAIHAALADFQEAFARRDPQLFGKNLAEDADWENAFGGTARSRAKIEELLAQVCRRFQQSSQTAPEVRIRFITPEVAVADSVRELTGEVR